MDKARRYANRRLAQMERDITDIYTQATAELTAKWNAFMRRGERRLSALLTSGDMEAYQKALRNYTLGNRWYHDMVESTTRELAHVNETALAYTQDQLPDIYATSFNQMATDLKNAHIGIRFDLVDRNTVKRMIIDGDIQLPKKKLSIPKDMRWNTKQINSAVLQGIIQGESLGQLAKRLYPIMDNNKSAAIRNARTLLTGAESRGRQDSYKAAQDDGIVMKKSWIATPDSHVRDWHIDMDGQEVDVDEAFVDGKGNELMYPGDPGGAPETVYNCRCTMESHIIGFMRPDGSISRVDYEKKPDEHDKYVELERERRGLI